MGVSGRHRNGIREVRTIIAVLQKEFAGYMLDGKFKIGIGPIHKNAKRRDPTIQRSSGSLILKIKGRSGGQDIVVWSSKHLWDSVECAVRRAWRKKSW